MLWLGLVLFVALTVAVVRGGRLSNLGDIRLRFWLLLPLALLMQGATELLPDEGWTATLGSWLILLSYLPLLAVVLLNRERPGMWLAGIGVLMNFVVIAVNGGMPVLEGAAVVASGFESGLNVDDFKHVELDAGTRLTFLADVIPLRIFGEGQVLSLGDVFLAVGLGRFLEAELRRPVRWFKPGVKLKGGSATRA